MLSVCLLPGTEARYFCHGADTLTAAIRQQLVFRESPAERLCSGLGFLLFDSFANDVDHEPKMSTARLVGPLQVAFFHFVEFSCNGNPLSFMQ